MRRFASSDGLGGWAWRIAVLGLGCVGVWGALGQTPSPCVGAKDGGSAAKPCPAAGKAPGVAEQFPYLGETPSGGEQGKGTGTPDAPATGSGDAGKGVKDRFPYPGETQGGDRQATGVDAPGVHTPGAAGGVKDRFPYPGEKGGEATGAGDTGGESSSSSSSGDALPDVDGKPGLKDKGSSGSTARGRRRLRPEAQKTLSDDERVEEDLSVAHFYSQKGNMAGAYLRVKDAVKLEPQAADATLALAEVAEKMGKRDEAIAAYTRYLELEPDGDGVKAARKSLNRLKP